MRRPTSKRLAVHVGGIVLGAGAIVLACALPADALWGKKKESEAPAAPAPAAPPINEQVVYTFDDEVKMREFTRLWQQRQGIVLKMTVLQSYWREEEQALVELNNKLTADYQLDVNKNYFLDSDRRVLIERELPPAPVSVAPAAEAEAPQPAAAQ